MKIILNLKMGFFLARRQIRRANLWTTGLIVFVMVLTFLNLVVVGGILIGLVGGYIDAYRLQYTGDIILSSLSNKSYIENSPNIINLLKNMPEVKSVSVRFEKGAVIEANYQTKKDSDKPDTTIAQLVGINPSDENNVTGLSSRLLKGSYLTPQDYDKVLIGYFLLKQYLLIETPYLSSLENVDVGTKIRITTNGITKEVTVKGLLKSKVDNISSGLFMIDSEVKDLIGRDDGNAANIAIKLKDGVDPVEMQKKLILLGINNNAKVQTYAQAQPKILKDITKTFQILGTMFGSIGLAVASITIYIVIFINALTRRKFIGILKGIGVNSQAIEFSYILQSIFYSFFGSIIGIIIVYCALVPYFLSHPIDFPLSDGILVAPFGETILRIGLLVLATIIAGYIPSRMIVRKNTLDSILGRN